MTKQSAGPRSWRRPSATGTTSLNGQNGRTHGVGGPQSSRKRTVGATTSSPSWNAAYPLDLVIIMLGTNDCKERFGVNGYNIAVGAGNVARKAKQTVWGRGGKIAGSFACLPRSRRGRICERTRHGPGVRRGLGQNPCEVVDYLEGIAGRLPLPGRGQDRGGDRRSDGVHLEPEEHAKLAKAMFEKVKESSAELAAPRAPVRTVSAGRSHSKPLAGRGGRISARPFC